MVNHNWHLETVKKRFHLEAVNMTDICTDIEPVKPSARLITKLACNVPLAFAISPEKAKSETIVANVLIELREQLARRISLFSDVDFNVDAEDGVVCDFLISLSPAQFHLEAPAIILIETKQDLTVGFGQCVSEMVAAQRFNVEKQNDIPYIYGAITSGIDWIFLKLEENRLDIDIAAYTIEQPDKILGILLSMVAQNA